MKNFKFFSNLLFDLDKEIISTKVNPICNEVLERIDNDNLDPEGEIHLVERLLYDNSSPRPPKELNVEKSIESFSPSLIPIEDSDSLIKEINLFLTPDDSMPPGIENDDYDSEFFLEEFLSNDSPSLPKIVSFYFDIPSPLDCPDFEASRAYGFVLRSLELHILSFIMGIQYPNLID
ncbi:hypothetical protein Tco_1158500 [Tanacetum coccineum]